MEKDVALYGNETLSFFAFLTCVEKHRCLDLTQFKKEQQAESFAHELQAPSIFSGFVKLAAVSVKVALVIGGSGD